MKKIVFASVLTTFGVLAASATSSCWQNAPSGGDVSDDAAIPPIPPIPEGGGVVPPDGTAPTDATIEGGEAGEAGSGDATAPIPPVVPYATPLVATGIGFGCRIDHGDVFCWGDNTFGQAGNAVDAGTPSPGDAGEADGGDAEAGTGGDAAPTDAGSAVLGYHQVAGVSNAVALALGDYHACAVTASQTIYCWGLNNSSQLGHSEAAVGSGDRNCFLPDAAVTICNPAPQAVALDASAVGIAAAGNWTCALASGGSVQCWGAIQTASDSNDPVILDGSTPCGSGTALHGGSCYPSFNSIANVSGATQLAVAFDHACALMPGNQLGCWGSNTKGQTASLNACPSFDCTSPSQGADLPTGSSAAVGSAFTCALGAGGTVSCLGDNSYGELGQSDAGGNSWTPLPVPGLGVSSELVAGGSQPGTQVACAIVNPVLDAGTGGSTDGGDGGMDAGASNAPSGPVTSGSVMCWGAIASDAGPGVPVTISGLPPMNALGVPGETTECGIAVDGSIWCWDLAKGTAPVQLPQ